MSMIGRQIGTYRILEKLGAGGLGVVYTAEDISLQRIVALKFLPPELSRDAESKQRFLHEARTASALDHNNICSIHGIHQTPEEQLFIVMSLYEGETLDKRIARGPMRVHDTLDFAEQLVVGLVHAHQNKVIHRDIKPANIMITHDNVVKILDFGIAKLADQMGITQSGAVLGTVTYMSPEQAGGRTVDHRTDIWSVGVIFYRMLTGQRPFVGESTMSVMYSILNNYPEPVTALRGGVPRDLEYIVDKCLEKDPDYRYQTMSDLLADLRRCRRQLHDGPTDTHNFGQNGQRSVRRASSLRTPGFIGLIAATVLLSIAAIYLLFQVVHNRNDAASSNPQPLVFSQLTSEDGLAAFPSWSPDGKWIVYSSDSAGSFDIWKKPLEGGMPERLTTDDEKNEIQPAWSPDGRTVAFNGGAGISLIPADGGTPYPVTGFGSNPVWSPDGNTIAFERHDSIYLVPYTGGEPRLLVAGTSGSPQAAWGPGGEKLIFWHRTKGDVHRVDVENGDSVPLKLVPPGEEISGLSWSPDGLMLIYSRGPFGGNKSLWKVVMDPVSGMPAGDPFPLSHALTDDIHCAFAPDGQKVAFTVRSLERHLWGLPLDPGTGLSTGESRQLTSRGNRNYYPSLSSDGKRLVWTSHRGAKGTLYTMLLEEGGRNAEEVKVSRDWSRNTREVGSCPSADGQQIAFSSTASGSYQIWRVPSVGSVALPITRTENPVRDILTGISATGEQLAFYSNRSGNWDLYVIPMNGGEPVRLTDWESSEMYPCWSPDGSRIAFRTDREGSADLWIMGSNGGNPKALITDPAEEAWPCWSPNGRWFYFLTNRAGVFNVWRSPAGGGEAVPVTTYSSLAFGLPDAATFGRFAVSDTLLVVPLESRNGNIYVLEGFH